MVSLPRPMKRRKKTPETPTDRVLDLTPVVDAMARGYLNRQVAGTDLTWDDLAAHQQHAYREVALAFLIPAVPAITEQLNERRT